MRLRSGLAISTSAAFAAAIAFACSSFEASEVRTDGGSDLDAAPSQDAGTGEPPRRWCADQDATFCDDFDDELDASFAPPWDEVEIDPADGVVERDDLTWRSPPVSFHAEATSLPDGGFALARLVKTFPATSAIEVAFDMYVGGVRGTDATKQGGMQRVYPLAIRCRGASSVDYGLTVEPSSVTATEYAMRIGDGTHFYPVAFANEPALESWKRVIVRFGVTQIMKPFVAVEDPNIDLIPPNSPLDMAIAPSSCAVRLGVSVASDTNATLRFDNVTIRTL